MNGWDVRPTLDRANANRRPLTQAAGSFVAGSPLPQALIQCRQRLTYELRLSTLVILSRPAPQLAAGDSAVAQPTTTPFTGLVRAPESIGDMPPRHILRPERHSAHSTACRAVWLYAPGFLNLVQPPQVAPASGSKLAPNPRSVSIADRTRLDQVRLWQPDRLPASPLERPRGPGPVEFDKCGRSS